MEESESSEGCESDEEESSGSNSGSGDDDECDTAQETINNAKSKTVSTIITRLLMSAAYFVIYFQLCKKRDLNNLRYFQNSKP